MAKRKPSEIPTTDTASPHVLRDMTLILSAMIVTGLVSYHLLFHLVPEPDKVFDLTPTASVGGQYSRWGTFHAYGTSPKTWREACQFFAPIIGFALPLGVIFLARHVTDRRKKRD